MSKIKEWLLLPLKYQVTLHQISGKDKKVRNKNGFFFKKTKKQGNVVLFFLLFQVEQLQNNLPKSQPFLKDFMKGFSRKILLAFVSVFESFNHKCKLPKGFRHFFVQIFYYIKMKYRRRWNHFFLFLLLLLLLRHYRGC